MSANNITELRVHLFDTLRALKDKDAPMDIDLARAVSDVAQTIINSAKVECDFIRATGNSGDTKFFPIQAPTALTAASSVKVIEDRHGLRVTQHRLQG